MNIILQQKQEMKMVMTQQLIQSIELLQYSEWELMQFIIQQQHDYPLIEIERESFELLPYRAPGTGQSNYDTLNHTVKSKKDFRWDLYESAKLTYRNRRQQQILYFIIFNLDENGYLHTDHLDLVVEGISAQELETGILLLQQIGPGGIGARTIEECLLLQLTGQDEISDTARAIIKNSLPLVAADDPKTIAAQLAVPVAKVKQAMQRIKTLHPKPCRTLADHQAQFLLPDIFVEMAGGHLFYKLNGYYFSNLTFDKGYLDLMQSKCDTGKFIQEQYKVFQWLQKSVASRKATLTKIMDVVIRRQASFFKAGMSQLVPMLMKEVADEIGMHESTVSRATKNKVIQTSFGTVFLRDLFTAKLSTDDGSTISQMKIKQFIKQRIGHENKERPLNDQKIAALIEKEFHIAISRRTVNKYRQELNIPNAKERKTC